MLSFYKIESNRQDNGLWGMPLKLRSIDGGIRFRDEEEKLFSAIVMSFAENHDEIFWLEMSDKFFILHTDAKTYYYNLSLFGLDDDKLYHLPTDDDKKIFDRMMKLKKLTHEK